MQQYGLHMELSGVTAGVSHRTQGGSPKATAGGPANNNLEPLAEMDCGARGLAKLCRNLQVQYNMDGQIPVH